MTTEPEEIGVDVWMAATIYVEAFDYDQAAEIVKERYAGSRERPDTYDHMNGENLPLDGDDFMSSAVTIYGLAEDSELMPASCKNALPVLKEAADMIAILMAEEGRLVNLPALEVMNKIDRLVSSLEGRAHD